MPCSVQVPRPLKHWPLTQYALQSESSKHVFRTQTWVVHPKSGGHSASPLHVRGAQMPVVLHCSFAAHWTSSVQRVATQVSVPHPHAIGTQVDAVQSTSDVHGFSFDWHTPQLDDCSGPRQYSAPRQSLSPRQHFAQTVTGQVVTAVSPRPMHPAIVGASHGQSLQITGVQPGSRRHASSVV
jgi:hypothetical protein